MTNAKNVVANRNIGKIGSSTMLLPSLSDGTRFNPDDTSVQTYRKMRKDHQISACISVIKFTMQRVRWYSESDDENVKKLLDDSIGAVWSQLIKSITKAVWAGYSPNVKVFEYRNGMIQLKKIKDLSPETCRVLCDEYGNFKGFKQTIGGEAETIAPEYAFWYGHQVEDGNLYGESMIKPAYKAWYFGELVHLFANRYYERFGEPVVLGRAPNNSVVEDEAGNKVDALAGIQATGVGLKSHSVATIPSDRDETGNYLYDLQYLESQMRGVDFDVYLKRLDMEKARGIFVPDLILGSGGGSGSYALGQEHKATFIAGIMGILDDAFEYINKYICQQLVDLNYPGKIGKIKYTPLSKITEDKIVDIVASMISKGQASADIQSLSDRIGIPLKEETPPVITEKPVKDIAKKQLDRITNYLKRSLLGDQKSAIDNLRIGFPEAFSSEDGYNLLEGEVKNKIKSCLSMSLPFEKTVEEVGRTLGLESIDTQNLRKTIREEAAKMIEEA